VIDFFLEITTEEMPPSHVREAMDQLRKKIPAELEIHKLADGKNPQTGIDVFGTCRRLIVAGSIPAQQKDLEEVVIGPPKAVGFSEDGKPTQAAVGFAKSKNARVSDLEVIKTDKGEYIGFKKTSEGKPAREILLHILPRVLSSFSFPKMMQWGRSSFRFSRPIKHILCLCEGKLLPVEIAGVKAKDFTYGHRLFFDNKIKVKSFQEYRRNLLKNKVIIDPERRRELILNQIEKKLDPLEAQVLHDDELLEKCVYDVEYPHVILGSFPDEYLNLPLEILSTAMKKGQNLFSVVKGKKQFPCFIGVADGYRDPKGIIRKGNERVLKARLEDAKFFWKQDLAVPLKKRAARLEKVVFQEKLGNYAEKVDRIKKISSYLADKLDKKKDKKFIAEACELSKNDLVTEMVREFPSLQGLVGGLYAREEKYPEMVWKAVYGHYRPQSMDDDLPISLIGLILSVSDKLDSVVGVIGAGFEVSGSKDPFGLRRNASSICRIILEKKWDISFIRLWKKVLAVYENKLVLSEDKIRKQSLELFSGRLEFILEKQGFRYDLINAVLALGVDNILHVFLRLKALDSLKGSPQFEPMTLIAKRVNNILKDQPPYRINTDLLEEKEERELHTTYMIIKENVQPLIAKGDYQNAQRIIFRMRSCIDTFFDHVLVMTDDNKLKRNRLALLQGISVLLFQIADYSKIVVSEQK